MSLGIIETPENLYVKPFHGKDKMARFSCPFSINPNNFLDYSKQDLDQGDERGLANSLTNIKRAIECQIDTLLYFYGFGKAAKRENWGFPKKCNILQEMGILSPKILEKINSQRVKLEHFYEKPDKERVEDALDVATLFVEFTNNYIPLSMCVSSSSVIDGIHIKTETGDLKEIDRLFANIKYNYKEGILEYNLYRKPKKHIITQEGKINKSDIILNLKMKAPEVKYLEWLKFLKGYLTGIEKR
ncbi:MAG: hypothetical protein KAS04_05120 [Candidatus Aenigmarchaeota archaeon]|nr:hypothetical protein [Candidatus Aenigmarchaeota archaeon]